MLLPGFLWISSVSLLTASPGTQKRIIGGRDADIHEAPWQVSLQKRGEHGCGGSIYSKTIIITAAHCLEIIDHIELFEIRAGSSKFNSGGTVIKLAAFKYHEWNRFTIENDVGIIKLKKPLAFTRNIQPIPLAKEDPKEGSEVMATGWGESFASKGPINLQRVDIQIKNKRLCKYKLQKFFPNSEICAGDLGKATCFGDSGGPLVANGTLVGIVSRGEENCLGHVAFSSVAYHRKWILNAIQTI